PLAGLRRTGLPLAVFPLARLPLAGLRLTSFRLASFRLASFRLASFRLAGVCGLIGTRVRFSPPRFPFLCLASVCLACICERLLVPRVRLGGKMWPRASEGRREKSRTTLKRNTDTAAHNPGRDTRTPKHNFGRPPCGQFPSA